MVSARVREFRMEKILKWGYRENRNIYEQSRSMSRSHSPTHTSFFSTMLSHHMHYSRTLLYS